MKFENWLLVSDIDGTICPEYNVIPQRNLDAVRRFQQEGGRFTLATGRHLQIVRHLVEAFEIRTPLILVNGGCIYDPVVERFTYEQYLNETAIRYVKELQCRRELLSVRLMTEDNGVYEVYRREDMEPSDPRYSKYAVPWAELEQIAAMRWRKALFVTSVEDAPAFRAFAQAQRYPDVSFLASSRSFYEMVPRGVSKGEGLLRVAQQLDIPMEHTIGIGDYENDLSLLQAAGFSAAPENAIGAAKRLADRIVCDSSEGAVGDLIDYLITHGNS